MWYKTGIRLLGVAQNPANGFPARLLGGGIHLDREQITLRASRVLLAAREPRLQTFARSLADTALSDDSWAERIGSTVVSKPPARWIVTDKARAMDEIELLVAIFHHTEAAAFGHGIAILDLTAVRIALTSADGRETAHVVRVSSEDEASVQKLSEQLEVALNGSERPDLRFAAIARVLKNDLMSESKTRQWSGRLEFRMAFKVAARTILQLGSELISSDSIAFYELIKNGFDAGSNRG